MDNEFIKASCVIRPEAIYQLQKDGVIESAEGPGFEIREDGSLRIYSYCQSVVTRKLMRIVNELDEITLDQEEDAFMGDNNIKRIKRVYIRDSRRVTRRMLDWLKDIEVNDLVLSCTDNMLDLGQYHRINKISYGFRTPVIRCVPTTLKRISVETLTRQFFIQLLVALPSLCEVDAGITIYTESNLLGLLEELMKHSSIEEVSRLQLYFPVTEAVVSRVLNAIGFHPVLTYIGMIECCQRHDIDPDYDGGFGDQLTTRISERLTIARQRRPLFYASQIIKGDLLRVLNEYLGL